MIIPVDIRLGRAHIRVDREAIRHRRIGDSQMTTTSTPTFRERAVTSVQRNAEAITIHVRGIVAPLVLKFGQLSDTVKAEAMGYGMEVRLTRAAAIEKDAKTGRSATAQDKYDAIKRLVDHYATGTEAWAMAGGGGGGLSADTKALIEALCRALGMHQDAAEEAVREMTTAERDALRVDDEIKPHLDAIYAERAKAGGTAGMITKNLLGKLRAKVDAQMDADTSPEA
jgi:hypothetical protein